MTALKPCPFCGGKAEQLHGFYVQDVQCKICGAIADTDKWNTRTPDIKIAVEALRGLSTISSNPVQLCDTLEYRAVRLIALNALKRLEGV